MSGESAALGQGTANPKAMTRATVRALCQLNTEFYERNAASFSQTRTAPWEGWRRCMAACGFDDSDGAALGQPVNAQTADQSADAAAQGLDDQAGEQAAESPAFQDQTSATQPINDPSAEGTPACSQAAAMGLSASRSLTRSVLDIACGNLRFEMFLANAYPHIDWSFFAVDNCEPARCERSGRCSQKGAFHLRRYCEQPARRPACCRTRERPCARSCNPLRPGGLVRFPAPHSLSSRSAPAVLARGAQSGEAWRATWVVFLLAVPERPCEESEDRTDARRSACVLRRLRGNPRER